MNERSSMKDEMTFLAGGGANFIGKSFYRFKLGDKLLGVDWGGGYGSPYDEPEYSGPLHWLFLSHAHLDHLEKAPAFHKRYPGVPIYATRETKELGRVIWNESIKIAERRRQQNQGVFTRRNRLYVPSAYSGASYDMDDIHRTFDAIIEIKLGEPVKLTEDIEITPVNSGHMLGSASFFIIYKGEVGFITNDICFRDRNLIKGAEKYKAERLRFLVRESTYISDTFLDREMVKENLIEATSKVLKGGGRVLIVSLQIDRMQDVLGILNEGEVNQEWPVYTEGSKAVTEIYKKFLPDESGTLSGNRFRDDRERERFNDSGQPAVIVSSSGMMIQDTYSARWAEKFVYNERDGVFFVNYQAPEEQGHALLTSDRGRFLILNGNVVRRECEVESFQLSSHMDKRDGEELEKNLNPEIIIYAHGDNNKIVRYLAEHANGTRRIKAEVGKEVHL